MKAVVLSALVAGVLATSSPAPLPVAPVNYGVILFPGVAELDAFGPLQILNQVSMTKPINLAVIAPSLLPVTDAPLNATQNPANSNFSQAFVPTHSFKHPPKHLDVLIVPGGLGTRAESQGLADAIKYIKDVYPSLKYIMSVCTGATLLGRAGVLDNKRATTNKQTWAFATSYGKNVSWSPTERWVVDGNIWTTGGVAAGLDGMLGFVEHLYGTQYAWNMSYTAEYVWQSNSSYDPFSKIFNTPGA